MFLSSYHHEFFRSYYHWQKWCPCKRSRSEVKVTEVKTHPSPFPDCNSSLNSHMMMKWCKKLDVAYERCPIVFMPPPLGAGGIMFSGCPSVRPSVCPSVRPSVRRLKYPLLTCTWVRWSTRPTVTVLQHVRPSVRPSVRLSVCPSGEVSGHFPENAWKD